MENEFVLGSEFKSIAQEAKREIIRGMLNRCTVEQQNLFNRMYKNINDIEEEKMDIAYMQCKRTLERNT